MVNPALHVGGTGPGSYIWKVLGTYDQKRILDIEEYKSAIKFT